MSKTDIFQIEKGNFVPGNSAGLSEDTYRLLNASIAEETKRTYASRIRAFYEWCLEKKLSFTMPISPELLSEYITFLVTREYSNVYIKQLCSAVRIWHQGNGFPSPTKTDLVKQLLKGATRTLGVAAKYKKPAISIEVLKKLLCSVSRKTVVGKRDAAILLVGFTGAFRRSELVSLRFEDISFTTAESGLPAALLHIRRGKTDQIGEGMDKAIFTAPQYDLCPVSALKEWIEMLRLQNINDGYIFRRIYRGGHHIVPGDNGLTSQTIDLIVKKYARLAQISYLDLSAHSLRSGFITTAINDGMSERSIMNQTGHKSTLILRGYFRRKDALADNAAENIFGK